MRDRVYVLFKHEFKTNYIIVQFNNFQKKFFLRSLINGILSQSHINPSTRESSSRFEASTEVKKDLQ